MLLFIMLYMQGDFIMFLKKNMSNRIACKFIALLCVLALILCGCVACGKSGENTSTGQSAASDSQTDDNSKTGNEDESTSYTGGESTKPSTEESSEEVTDKESGSKAEPSKSTADKSQTSSKTSSTAGSSNVTSKETSSKKTETSSKKPETSSKKPEASSTKPEASSTKPEASSVAPAKTAIEIITDAIDKLNHASAAKCVLTGTTVANAGIKLNQTTDSTHIVVRSGSSVTGYCTNVSKSSFVDTNDTIRSDGTTCTITDKDGKVTKYSYSEYLAARGPLPEEMIPYVINSNTLKSGSKITSKASGNNTVYSFSLNINNAANSYKNALKANAEAGGATFKQIKNIDLTMTIDKNGNLLSMTVKESYDMNKTVIVNLTVTCESEFTYTFTTGKGISIPK